MLEGKKVVTVLEWVYTSYKYEGKVQKRISLLARGIGSRINPLGL